jgi:GNAT superfamily N-acetyltransferase
MIKTQLSRNDALEILELGRQLHQESQFKDSPYDDRRCWGVLEATLRFPEKFFIAYDDGYNGFILMQIQEHYWSGHKWAVDFGLYVVPEKRGTPLAYRLVQAAERWAKANDAKEMTIYHNTGIDTDKAVQFFNKVGYRTAGHILTKEF